MLWHAENKDLSGRGGRTLPWPAEGGVENDSLALPLRVVRLDDADAVRAEDDSLPDAGIRALRDPVVATPYVTWRFVVSRD